MRVVVTVNWLLERGLWSAFCVRSGLLDLESTFLESGETEFSLTADDAERLGIIQMVHNNQELEDGYCR